MGYQNQQQEELSLSEILQIRRDKLTALQESGADPFVKTKYDVDAYSLNIFLEKIRLGSQRCQA